MPLSKQDPFVGQPPREVPLPNAPLVRVVAQVRFPMVLSLAQASTFAPLQSRLKERYPVLRQEQTQQFLLGPGGAASGETGVLWRLSDAESRWRVSLSPGFVALETTAYRSRADLLERLAQLLGAVEEEVAPTRVDRLGLRYIDRVTGKELSDIASLVRPEMLGIAGSETARYLKHALSESLFAVDSAHLLARWGLLPSEGTVDPSAIEAIGSPSWILDLDMFSTEARPFETQALTAQAKQFAGRIYAFFRWAVTDAFLKRYGGQP